MGAGFDDLSSNAAVRVLAITGRGKAFSAGGNMKIRMTLGRKKNGGVPGFSRGFGIR